MASRHHKNPVLSSGSAAPVIDSLTFVDWGNVPSHADSDETLTLTNNGNLRLKVTGIGFSSDSYSVVGQSFPFYIQPGNSHDITLRFNGVYDPNNFDATEMWISSNDPVSPQWYVFLASRPWNIYTNFPNDDASPIANPTLTEIGDDLGVTELDGTWNIASGQAQFTAQATVNAPDLSLYSQNDFDLETDVEMVFGETIRQNTFGSSVGGIYANQTIDTSPILGVTIGGATTVRPIFVGSAFGADTPYGFPQSEEVNLATTINGSFAQCFAKLGGIWRRLWRLPHSASNHYVGVNNSNAVGYYKTLRLGPLAGFFFEPYVNLSGSQAAGTTFSCDSPNSLIKYVVTLPASGTIEFFFRIQDGSNYYQIDISSAGALNLYSVVAGVKSASLASGTGITSGNVLGLSLIGSKLVLYRGVTLVMAPYYLDKFLSAVNCRINSLGTGGISDVTVDNHFAAYEAGLGNEVVSNGSFASDTAWTKGTNWTISGGTANKSTGTASNLTQACLTLNEFYEISFTISNYSAGTLRFSLGGSPHQSQTFAANGTYTFRGVAHATVLTFLANATFVGSIDNVSVKPITLNINGLHQKLDEYFAA